MALIIGIHCSDGVVIGTDSAAASDPLAPTASREFQQRIAIIDDRVIVAGTGAVGLGQRFTAITGQHWASKGLQNKSAVEIGKMLSESALEDFGQTGIDPLRPSGNQPEDYGALVAIPCGQGPALLAFPAVGFQPEVKTDGLWYAAMGSARNVADPLLGFVRITFWESHAPPSCQEGIFAATLVLKLGCALYPGGVAEPVQMAVLRPQPGRKGRLLAHRLTEDELSEHEQSMEQAIRHFRGYRETFRGKGRQVPSLPIPPSW